MRMLAFFFLCLAYWSQASAETLTGVVLEDDGQPAAGAAITAAATYQSPPLRFTTKTDEQGSFRVDLPKVEDPVSYAFAVRWNGQGTDFDKALDANGKKVDITGQSVPPQTVRLRPQGELDGKLLRAEDDGPIKGAKLYLETGEVLTTDDDGAFKVSGLRMKDHSLIPVAPGRVRPYILFDTTGCPKAELELRLVRGATIRGQVLDQQGQRISGAYLTRASSGMALTLNGWDEACQADGSFEYSGLSTEQVLYSLQASAEGYHDRSISGEVNAPGEVIERVIRLSKKSTNVAGPAMVGPTTVEKVESNTTHLPWRTITGTVRDGDGLPVQSATIHWGTFQWDTSAKSTKTDANGRYTLAEVPPNECAILVIADGFAPQFAPVGAQANQVDVQLSQGKMVRGIVRGTSDKPVSGVYIIPQVVCRETGFCNPIWFSERSTSTNERGEFEMAAVPDGATFDFLKDGFSEQRGVMLMSDGAVNEIQLSAGGAIRGKVVDATGKPVRNFKIRMGMPRGLAPDEHTGGHYAGYNWYGVTFTRDDGVFVVTGITAGFWDRLIVSSPSVGMSIINRARAEPLDLLSPPENLTIELKPYVPLHVKVVDKTTGRPISGAQVLLLEDEPDFSRGFNWGYDDRGAIRMRTNDDGTATFAEPACEDGTVIVRASGYARQRIGGTPADHRWNFSLDPAASLKGEVRLDSQLLSDGYVRLTSAANDSISVGLEETGGGFEFAELPAGVYQLAIVNKYGRTLNTQQIELERGQSRSETINLTATANTK